MLLFYEGSEDMPIFKIIFCCDAIIFIFRVTLHTSILAWLEWCYKQQQEYCYYNATTNTTTHQCQYALLDDYTIGNMFLKGTHFQKIVFNLFFLKCFQNSSSVDCFMRNVKYFGFLSRLGQTAMAASWEVAILTFTELWVQMPPELLQALPVTAVPKVLRASESGC